MTELSLVGEINLVAGNTSGGEDLKFFPARGVWRGNEPIPCRNVPIPRQNDPIPRHGEKSQNFSLPGVTWREKFQFLTRGILAIPLPPSQCPAK